MDIVSKKSLIDLSGQKFNSLLALWEAHKDNQNKRQWLCRCDCGREIVCSQSNLKRSKVKSCGCTREVIKVGERFERLVVVQKIGLDSKGRNTLWLCMCDCGKESIVRTFGLRDGSSRSCGCLVVDKSKTHGLSKSPTHMAWIAMRSRCMNPNNQSWKNYGGRGITVCERWLNFENFLADMGECPKGLSLERIDNDGNYEPQNCKWATTKEQGNNKRSSKRITFQGVTKTISQWAECTGIERGTINSRLKNGWSIERALTEPVDTRFSNKK